jgi:hypothetical protein
MHLGHGSDIVVEMRFARRADPRNRDVPGLEISACSGAVLGALVVPESRS